MTTSCGSTSKPPEQIEKGIDDMSALAVRWILGWGSGAVRAVVLMKGWEWFVTDTFGAPAVGFIEAWGLGLLVSFATVLLPKSEPSTQPMKDAIESIVASLFLSGLFFLSMLILVGFR